MPESTTTPAAPFVGRQSELQRLHQALSAAIGANQPRFVLIQGDFGVGKSALVERFLAEAAIQSPSVLIGLARCAMETAGNGLIPFSQLLAGLTDKGVQRRAVLTSLAEFVGEVAPAWLDIFTLGVAGTVIEGGAKTIKAGAKLMGRSAYSQENVFVQFANALSRLADKHPVIAWIDDLHWADASSLQLLFHLARFLSSRAILFISTYRPVEAMETGPNAALFRDVRANLIRYGAVEMELRQGIDVAQYVAQRYPHNTFAPDFVRRIQQSTDGHPLFTSQLFSLWEETGVIVPTPQADGRPIWEIARSADAPYAIPRSLSEVLDERIRLIEGEMRETLTCASIEGEDFTAQVIAHLRQLDEVKVLDNLETLEDRYRLIQEQESKAVASAVLDFYRFAHRFIREHIYANLKAGKRRILHRQVGECLEALYGKDSLPIAGQLALHFSEALEPLKAARYALAAARFEQSRFAWTESENWCAFGLAQIGESTSAPELAALRLDLLTQSGYGHYNSGKFPQASGRYRAALDLAQQMQTDAVRLAGLCERLAEISMWEDELAETMRYLDRGRQTLAERGVAFGEMHVRLETLRGFSQAQLGNYDDAVQSLRNALAAAESLPHSAALQQVRAQAYDWLGVALSRASRYREALAAYESAIDIANQIGERRLPVICLLNIADNYVATGEIGKGEAYVQKGLASAEEVGDQDSLAYGRSIRAAILLAQGSARDAVAELTRAIELARQLGSDWNMPYMVANLAMAHLALSELEAAHRWAAESVRLVEKASGTSEKASVQFALGYALDALARVEAAGQNWESASQHFTRAIAVHHKAGHRLLAARAQRDFAEGLLRQARRQEAVALLRAALATFQELSLESDVAETQKLLDESAAQGA
jgi:predicted ATPase